MVTSIDYPSMYPPLRDFTQHIVVHPGYRVALYITELDMESCAPCTECDYLQVYDGSEGNNQIGRVGVIA